MTVGFDTFFSKIADAKFVVKNILTNKTIKIFEIKIPPGSLYDLMTIPEVSEADIKHSILKGVLRNRMNSGDVIITDSNINLVQYNTEFIRFMQGSGIEFGVRDHENDERIITNLIDLPAAVNGVITLNEDNILYKIKGQVDLGSNKILVTAIGTQFEGRGPNFDALIGNVAGPLLDFTKSTTILNLVIINPSGIGLKIDSINDTSILEFVWFFNCQKAAVFQNINALLIQEPLIGFCFDGITVSNINAVQISGFLFTNTNFGSAIGLTIPPNSTFNSVNLHNSSFIPKAGQIALSIDPTVIIGDRGIIHNNTFDALGPGTPLVGIDKKRLLWRFSNNSGISDSLAIGSIGYASSTPTEVTINTINEWVLINGPYVLSDDSERFSLQNGNSIIYDGYFTHQSEISAIINIKAATGNSNLQLAIGINGIPDPDSIIESEVKSTYLSYSLLSIATLEQDDDVGVFVRNITNTNNFDIRTIRLIAL